MELPTLVWPDVVLLPGESLFLREGELGHLALNAGRTLQIGQVNIRGVRGDQQIIGALISVRTLTRDNENDDEEEGESMLQADVIGVFHMLSWRRREEDEEPWILARVEVLLESEMHKWSTRPYSSQYGNVDYAHAVNRLPPKVITTEFLFENVLHEYNLSYLYSSCREFLPLIFGKKYSLHLSCGLDHIEVSVHLSIEVITGRFRNPTEANEVGTSRIKI